MSKAKGSRAERELFHKFWEQGFAVCRSAGSGSTTKPAPDLLAGDGEKIFAIECKSIKGTKKYFDVNEIVQLNLFANTFGAEAWLAIRFDKVGWFFIQSNNLEKSKGESLLLSLEYMRKKGFNFEELIGKYRQKKLKGHNR
ncbi:Holliday junction resolvase [archaeon]|jgi:holliday junction resolvase Hjr|nr:Holliday junction resolvase [archaeon]MBT4397757.1 Holliday junction resolvase [archaeon]MBT4440548.1 Holliday junction resolvase [archaeon]